MSARDPDDVATIAALREENRALAELAERRRVRLAECHQQIANLEAQLHRRAYVSYGPSDLCC